MKSFIRPFCGKSDRCFGIMERKISAENKPAVQSRQVMKGRKIMMKLLITGAEGFIGKNLITMLESQNDGKYIIYKYNSNEPKEMLDQHARDCDFVFHLPEILADGLETRCLYNNMTVDLLETLEKYHNYCPILYHSILQEVDEVSYTDSSQDSMRALLNHAKLSNSKVIIYRLPHIFGKWADIESSFIAGFCFDIARGYDITITDRNQLISINYIDDVIDAFISHLKYYDRIEVGHVSFHQLDRHLQYSISLGELTDLLYAFRKSRENGMLPNTADPFMKKLYSTYISYLPEEDFKYSLNMHIDTRGSFTEVFKTEEYGQLSINITKAGIKKGEHWHRTKCEKFLVVYGRALIQLRKLGEEDIISVSVTSDRLEIIDIPVGYTHRITNIGDCDLIILIWSNEVFDPNKTDTFMQGVDPEKKN